MATRQAYWFALELFCGWLHARSYTPTNVAAAYVARLERRGEVHAWESRAGKAQLGRGKAQLAGSEDVARYLLAASRIADPLRRLAAELPLRLGLRSGELLHLTAASVDVPARRLHVRDLGGSGA